jgi:hypothetical protein
MTENEQNLRDLTAMFAMCGLVMNGDYSLESIPALAYKTADAMLAERNGGADDGIASIKPKRKYERKATD